MLPRYGLRMPAMIKIAALAALSVAILVGALRPGGPRLRKPIAVAALLAVLSISAGGCGWLSDLDRPPGITNSDLIGTYSGSDAGIFELRSDGHFVATDMHDIEWGTGKASGSGTWRLAPLSGGSWDIGLEFIPAKPDGLFWSDIHVGGSKEHPILWYYAGGDEDAHDIRTMKRTS
jgi:hypothetical protein